MELTSIKTRYSVILNLYLYELRPSKDCPFGNLWADLLWADLLFIFLHDAKGYFTVWLERLSLTLLNEPYTGLWHGRALIWWYDKVRYPGFRHPRIGKNAHKMPISTKKYLSSAIHQISALPCHKLVYGSFERA